VLIIRVLQTSELTLRVAVCCSVLQCVAVCCSVSQSHQKESEKESYLLTKLFSYLLTKPLNPSDKKDVPLCSDPSDKKHVIPSDKTLLTKKMCLCALAPRSLQHTATYCNTMQHKASHCITMQHTVTHCNSLQHTAAHCSTLQNTA